MQLIKYDAACRAIAEAKSVDEIKDFRDKSKAIEAYAKQANNKTLQADAMEITLRAERRLGELLAAEPKATGGQPYQATGSKVEPVETPTLADMGIDKKLSARSQKIAQVEPDEFEAIVESAREKIATPRNIHVANNSGENEWYTPLYIIELARVVMNGIDYDPASSGLANETIQAADYSTKERSGLDAEWWGCVWMNPPYAQPLVSDFCALLLRRYEAGEIDQACVLVNNATETAWLQPLLQKCDAVCFIKGRVRFIDKDGNPGGAPLQGQCVLYFGGCAEQFRHEFSTIGIVFDAIPG